MTPQPQKEEKRPAPNANWSDLRHAAEMAASSMPALQVEAERVANTVAFGIHGRRRTGQGESFWQFRRYQPGDMRTAIDWRKTARSQHTYVREYEWEAADSVWIWRDGAPTNHYASVKGLPTKWQRASVIAIAMASLLVRGGERIAALGSPNPPGTGRTALRQFARYVSTPESATEAHLPETTKLPRYAKLLLISDFLAPLDYITRRLDEITAMGVQGHLLQVCDPSEEDFPFSGHINFKPFGQGPEITFGKSEDIRAEYRQAYGAHREAIAAHARNLGWTFAHHRTDKGAESALLALYNALSQERAFL
ncbi:MAG: DUF58 domain-containing protein [Alphaproteobacteria bacterium]|nr:MAG: DUF58 domain-containing protein [Alphaproteobacteria bacterium]